MSTPACLAARECAPELALGVLDGEERGDVLDHVHGCPSCQSTLSELAGVADVLAQLTPELEPPEGFGRRVVDATRPTRWRTRRRWIATVAAVAAAAAIGAVTLVRVVDAGRGSSVAAPALHRATMRGTDGVRVGSVVAAEGSPGSLAVTVHYAVPDGRYTLAVHPPDASSTDVATIAIVDGRGAWTGRVERVGAPGFTVQLVDAAGTVVCRAEVRV